MTEKLFDSVFYEYYGLVYTIVYDRLSETAQREDIEECISDIFAEVFAMLDEKQLSNGNLKGFIRTVAVRRAIDTYRHLSAKADHCLPEEEAENIADSSSADVYEQPELRSVIMKRIEELGIPDSIIVVRKYYFGLSYREIADDLSMSEAAVRKRSARALKKLKEQLIKDGIKE